MILGCPVCKTPFKPMQRDKYIDDEFCEHAGFDFWQSNNQDGIDFMIKLNDTYRVFIRMIVYSGDLFSGTYCTIDCKVAPIGNYMYPYELKNACVVHSKQIPDFLLNGDNIESIIHKIEIMETFK